MKVFLSYEFKDNISEIIKILKDQGIEIFDSLSDIEYGNSYQKAIKNAIKECDFVFLVCTNENQNIAFEAGIAIGSNKPIFSVLSLANNNFDFLFDSTYVQALPSEIDKIKFNLEIFLKNIKPKKTSSKLKPHKFYGGGFPNYFNDINNNYNSIINKNEKEFELLFKDIFEKYQLNVIQNKFDYKSKFYADFCVWSDKLSNVLGNPILIEIKKEINSKNIIDLKNNIEKLISNNSAESCLVFYDILIDIGKRDLPNSSKYLFINISDFIEKLNEGDFNQSIRKIRNEIIHNQY